MSQKWLEWAKRIQALSQAGLTFSKDDYDIERYKELREISSEIMQEYTGLKMEQIKDLFTNETGYQTPKVDVRGVVFKDNKILMVKEKNEQKWALPGGFCDVGLSPSENIVKEIKEEAGFDVSPIKLLACLDMSKHLDTPQPYHYYKLFIHCEIIGGEATNGLETNGVDFYEEGHLPSLSIRRNTEAQINLLFQFLDDPMKNTILD
ncbi:NUDIX hydrolase [Bacillus spongiae]|uniref:NUDIX hydrolase n=1 Tax=Bacillus spongiae TaxID=2683610 RepID=A0ABU8HJU4_9BACI